MPPTNSSKGSLHDFLRGHPAWYRLEPRARSDDVGPGLEARTADPLWMLARQWQLGEFQAQDSGSPAAAQVEYTIQPIKTVRLGDSETALPLADLPLETLVERERHATDYRSRVQMGQQFERLLRTRLELAGLDHEEIQGAIRFYRDHFELHVPADHELVEFDEPTQRFIRFMAGRVCDGQSILDSQMMDDAGQIEYPDCFATTGSQERAVPAIQEAFELLSLWRTTLLSEPTGEAGTAWDNSQLLYHFETNLSGPEEEDDESALVVPDYRSGELDWYSFACKSDRFKIGAESNRFETIPTRLDVAGQSPRWWAFGNSQLNLSQLHTLTTDLAKILFTEFVSDYSDDWFQLPLEVPIGSVVSINSFRVTDVFDMGQSLPVAGYPGKSPLDRWEIYTLGRAPAPNEPGVSVLLVPPLAGYRQESEPLEEIRFTRDEGANLVWAIEERVPNGLGQPVQGREAQRARRVRRLEFKIAELERDLADAVGDSEDPSLTPENRQIRAEDATEIEAHIALLQAELDQTVGAGGIPRYRLSTTVPENWIPFLPYNIGDFLDRRTGSIVLRRAGMWRDVEATGPELTLGSTSLLQASGQDLRWLEEEAVPRAGVRVILTRQRVRWRDGATYVWLGRKVLTGHGEENSGLRFDLVVDTGIDPKGT